MSKPKLAVIGASHFQMPLILKAQEMGCEVHAFAWQCGDVGETAADVFHPVSIVEVDQIVEECRRIGVDGICTIASDLATVAVNHVAHELGLVGNSLECTQLSTNKSCMRRAFEEGGDPSPKSILVCEDDAAGFDPLEHGLSYPLIVKPIDRSGSRGVTKLEAPGDPMTVGEALANAFEQGFAKSALVEEFAEGDEFSVEGISWRGEHRILTITRKATTGAPHFIESGHLQPAGLDAATEARVRDVVVHALSTLGVENGASHSELKIAPDGTMRIIEIGARMGGDCIGSDLVPLSTGVDFVRAVVDIALGREPDLNPVSEPQAAAIRFMFEEADFQLLDRVRSECPNFLQSVRIDEEARAGAREVTDSSTRLGHFILAAPAVQDLLPYLGLLG
ncbi:MAG: ATP-grasp domain-containing protein [Coriobacteriaceae bacterium]|nr:ATP-grasp domain-containing protein [Coriobacteriaceae bacterium]